MVYVPIYIEVSNTTIYLQSRTIVKSGILLELRWFFDLVGERYIYSPRLRMC